MKIIKRVIVIVLLVAILIYLASCVLLPRFHKEAPEDLVRRQAELPPDLGPANERVLCVDDNEQALLWRLRIIEAAQNSLVLTTFDYGDDEGGRNIMAALYHAAERGVQIRIIVDGINGWLNLHKADTFHALAGHDNIEVRLYNPIRLHLPWRLNYRMHDKYVIADETVFMLGGRNTNNLFLGDYQQDKNIDRDIVVYSPISHPKNCLHQLLDYFEGIWALPCTKEPSYPDKGLARGRSILLDQYENLQHAYPEAFLPTDWEGSTIPAAGVKLLSNPIEPSNKEPLLWGTLMSLMDRAQQITVQTPYIICGKQMYSDLKRLTSDGKQLDVIINANESGANPWGCTDYLNQRKKIQNTGIHIYEYLGPCSSHTKTVLLDDRLSAVGSFNFDMRSAYLDTELMLLIDSPELNAYLRSMAEDDMTCSKHVSPDGNVSLGSGYKEVELSFGKHLFYGFIRIFSVPFRPLL